MNQENNKNICRKCKMFLFQTDGMTAGEFNQYGCGCKFVEVNEDG